MSRPSQSGQGAAPTPSVRRSGDDVLVRLDFTDEVAYYAWIERLRSASPILRLAERLDEGARLRIESVHGAQRDELVAEVRQVFRSGADLWGTLIEVCEDDAGEEAPDGPQESAEPSAEPDGKQGGEGEVEGDPDPDDDDETTRRGETYGASAFFELQKLNPNQKMMLATRANRQQRQLLLRDTSQAIQMALLSNPRLESKELLEIARNPQTTGGVLQRQIGRASCRERV